MNKGVKIAGAYHNTGEGGLSPYHSNGGDVVFHFGTGYFGVRAEDGGFSMEKMVKLVEDNPFIRAIEVKLSQGAKPGKGGVLPGKKITNPVEQVPPIIENALIISGNSTEIKQLTIKMARVNDVCSHALGFLSNLKICWKISLLAG